MTALWFDRYRAYVFAKIAAGAEVDGDDAEQLLNQFNVWLTSPPEYVDPDRYELEKALGVGRWRR